MVDRHSSHVLDTGALDVLPAAAPAEALQPDPADEAAHTPGRRTAVERELVLGLRRPRAGRRRMDPAGTGARQNVAWINALICGPDMPTVALLDFHAPLPENPNDIRSGDIEIRHAATVPLREYTVTVSGPARAYDDPAALLGANPAAPPTSAWNWVWTTSGTTYAYRIATRYEIPCTVSGAVTADNAPTTSRLSRQRDHSHGVRDWWSMDWVWSALHLDDGTHLHGLTCASPNAAGRLHPAAGSAGDRDHCRHRRRHTRRQRPVADHRSRWNRTRSSRPSTSAGTPGPAGVPDGR